MNASPSMVSSSPSLIHVTMVAGEPVEVQVKALAGRSNSSEVMTGVTVGKNAVVAASWPYKSVQRVSTGSVVMNSSS